MSWDKTIAALLAVMMPMSAFAADKGGDRPSFLPIGEIATRSAWTGCYVGAAVGYGITRSEFESFQGGEGSLNAEDVLLSPSAGCDVQAANMVFGIMGDITFSNLDAAWENQSAMDADWQWFLGGRGGVLITDRTLVYGLIGYTQVDGGLTFDGGYGDATNFGDMQGITYGGGVETLFQPGWSLKLEYRYVQIEEETAPNGVEDGLANGTDIDSGAHQVRLGLAYRFGASK